MHKGIIECHLCNKKKPLVEFSSSYCQTCKDERRDIRNKIQKEEMTKRQSEEEVNKIFRAFEQLKHQESVSFDKVKLHSEVPSVHLNSIKAFSIQMLKLDNMNLKIKSNYLKRAVDRTQQRIDSIVTKVGQSKIDLEKKKEMSEEGMQTLVEKSLDTTDYLDKSIEELEVNKIDQVRKQAIRLQQKNFAIFKDMSLVQSNGRLLLMNQSILKLEDFLGSNMLVINQFLENLIVFQSHLASIFNFELPFLVDLLSLLPNTSFFNLIKDRGDLITGTESDALDVEETDKEQDTTSGNIDTTDIEEKVIKLGNTIKLPLSSKTINNQRRASLTKTPETEETVSQPDEKQSFPLKSIGNKKLIIVPHKLLVKPFTKLSIKEFLRFLGVLVKIITNFKVFILLAGGHGTEESIEDYIYDFGKTLEKVSSSDVYYESMLDDLSSNPGSSASAALSSDINSSALYSPGDVLELKMTMDKIYQLIVKGSRKDNFHNASNAGAPSIFHDLNLSDLIANQAKFHLDDWDIVSKIF